VPSAWRLEVAALIEHGLAAEVGVWCGRLFSVGLLAGRQCQLRNAALAALALSLLWAQLSAISVEVAATRWRIGRLRRIGFGPAMA